MAFSGTQQKCKACDKTVHFIDLLSADGVAFHKTCFKCSHCNGQLVVYMIHYCLLINTEHCNNIVFFFFAIIEIRPSKLYKQMGIKVGG